MQKTVIEQLTSLRDLVSTGSFDVAEEELERLERFVPNDDLVQITLGVYNRSVEGVLPLIDRYIDTHERSVSTGHERERQEAERQALAIELSELTAQKTDLEKTIIEWDLRIQRDLLPLARSLAKMRNSREPVKPAPSTEEEWFAYLHSGFMSFSMGNERLASDWTKRLNESETAELKIAFRKACKRCHPDLAPAELQQKAETIFIELKRAYDVNDLGTVLAILERLEAEQFNGGIGRATSGDLAKDIVQLRARIEGVKEEIDRILRSESFVFISKSGNIERYFAKTRSRLQHEINYELGAA